MKFKKEKKKAVVITLFLCEWRAPTQLRSRLPKASGFFHSVSVAATVQLTTLTGVGFFKCFFLNSPSKFCVLRGQGRIWSENKRIIIKGTENLVGMRRMTGRHGKTEAGGPAAIYT